MALIKVKLQEHIKHIWLEEIHLLLLEENTQLSENIPTGVSIESAAYIENNSLTNNEADIKTDSILEEEYTPKLFSEDQSYQSDEEMGTKEESSPNSDELFNQDLNEEDDFEIPAFLRKQKF